LAFFAFSSLIPMLLVISSAIALVVAGSDDQNIKQQLVDLIAAKLHSQVLADAIMSALIGREEQMAVNGALGSLVGVTLLVVAAAAFFEALSAAFALISADYRPAPRSASYAIIQTKLASTGFVVLMVLLVIILHIGAITLVLLSSWLPNNWFWRIVDIVISTLTTTVLFALLFRYLSGISIPARNIWAGSLLAAVMWQIGQQVLSFYFAYTNGFSFYGIIGGVLAFLLYMYYWSQILLFGAEFALVSTVRSGVWRDPSIAQETTQTTN
jgi:membrane protein